MNKKHVIILILILSLTFTYSNSRNFSGSLQLGSEEKNYVAEEFRHIISSEKSITPKTGMMPVFEEKPFEHEDELIKDVRDVINSKNENIEDTDDNSDKSSVNSFETNNGSNNSSSVNATQDTQSYSNSEYSDYKNKSNNNRNPEVVPMLENYINHFSRVKVIENQIRNNPDKPLTEDEEREYVESLHEFENIGTEIADEIENAAENTINSITEFILDNVNKGDLIALGNVVDVVLRFLESEQNIIEPEAAETLHKYFSYLYFTVEKLIEFLESDDMMEKYYILYVIINNIFIEDYEKLDAPEIDEEKLISITEEPDEYESNIVAEPDENVQSSGQQQVSGNISVDIVFSNLMENFEFTDADAISPEAIQAFLETKGSVLKNKYRGQFPSTIIYAVCSEYNINPKVILATIQKEHSLISRSSASQSQLDWALGVGCYDDGTKNQKFKGLEKQLASAVKVFRHWYDDGLNRNVSNNSISMRVNYNSANLTVENEASYSLYKYTPHTVDIRLSQKGGGNYLFGMLYRQYFGGFLR
ncbi:MAG: hypothetical protein ACQESP_01295 [Candidatus Muiribacteriota bacterium]